MTPIPFLSGAHWLSAGRPRILCFPHFLTAAECQRVRAMARRKGMEAALLADDLSPPGLRTSSSCWLGYQHSRQLDYYNAGNEAALDRRLLQSIAQRSSVVSSLPEAHGETFQVLRYQAGQYYGPHVDYFHPQHHPQEWEAAGQRVATLLVYLNTPNHRLIQGGETHFPKVKVMDTTSKRRDDNSQQERSRKRKKRKQQGLLVRPQQGMAILFWNVQTENPQRVEPYSLHESVPIVRLDDGDENEDDDESPLDAGDEDATTNDHKEEEHLLAEEKWTLTRWIRQRPFPIPMRDEK